MSSEAATTASCHCGKASIRLTRRPDYINRCNCSLCAKTGWHGIYYASNEVEIYGAFDSYVREDMEQPMIRILRCATCGISTHWEPLSPPPHARMGINARLVDPGFLDGIEVRDVDGASWDL